MLFNSFVFLFLFLPVTLGLYFVAGRFGARAAATWLVLASLFFYAYWDPWNLVLLCASLCFNFAWGLVIAEKRKKTHRWWALFVGIVFNLGLLFYYKYSAFFGNTVAGAFGSSLTFETFVLPLAISFFTFNQIAYIVDVYHGKVKDADFLNYVNFVTFFPHLIAGPVVHHREMMPQFGKLQTYRLNWSNIALGLFIFSIGLFKKVVIADNLAPLADAVYGTPGSLPMIGAWVGTMAYTFQLYFDFSGYADMAIGFGLLFNIVLPENFNSPYKATSLQDFWRRWHMTLSHFLKDHLYIPMGGNRRGFALMLRNLFITFLLGGLWHGAAWGFVLWGALHGAGLVVEAMFRKVGLSLPRVMAWGATFVFVSLCWVPFRAVDLHKMLSVYASMAGLNGIVLPDRLARFAVHLPAGTAFGDWLKPMDASVLSVVFLAICALMAWFGPNTARLAGRFKVNNYTLVWTGVMLFACLASMNRASAFLYFNF